MNGLGAINTNSQPSIPVGVVGQQRKDSLTPQRKDSGFFDDLQNPTIAQRRPSTMGTGGGLTASPGPVEFNSSPYFQSETFPTSYSPNLGPIGTPSNIPSRMRSVDGLGFRLGSGDHMRYPSTLSTTTNASYSSARSSPSPPDQQLGHHNHLIAGLQRRDSKSQIIPRRGSQSLLHQQFNHQQYLPLHQQLNQTQLINPNNNNLLYNSGAPTSSLRPDYTNHGQSQFGGLSTAMEPVLQQTDALDPQRQHDIGNGLMDQNDAFNQSLLRSVNADRSYPLIESSLKREASQMGHIGEGELSMSAGSSTGSGSLSMQPPGAFFRQDNGPQSQSQPPNEATTSEATHTDSGGSRSNSLDDSPNANGKLQPSSQMSDALPTITAFIPRSDSLSVPNATAPSMFHAGPTRKSSVASFTMQDYQALQQQQQQHSQNTLPSSFHNYTLGGDGKQATRSGEGTLTPGASGSVSARTPNDNSSATTPNTSSTASVAGINPLTNTQPTTTSSNSLNRSGSGGVLGADTLSNQTSTSPSSSVRSSSVMQFDRVESPGNMTQSQTFESQAKSSPFLNDILDRLIRYEYATRDIQRELGTLNRHVEFLVNRAMAADGPSGGNFGRRDSSLSPSQGGGLGYGNGLTPTASTVTGTGNLTSLHGGAGSSTSSLLLPPGTPSNNREKEDDVRMLNQKINALTSSVSQLLQLQTQAHIQSVNAGLSPALNSPANFSGGSPAGGPLAGASGGAGGLGTPALIGGPVLSLSTPELSQSPMGAGSGGPMGGSGVIGRPSPRAPIPVRTWSSGSMDMGLGGMSNSAPLGAGGPAGPSMLGGKRRSVAPIGRRDSAGTGADSPGGDWSREASTFNITKWEHLPLTTELLRSIAKYGVGPPNKIQQRALPFLLRGADIIAQAPPTQERIAAYVIPAINAAVALPVCKTNTHRGPVVVIISTTVDQATQAQRMVRDLGGPIGVRSALAVGTGGDVNQELRLLQQSMPHILCGTPKKLHALFTEPNGGLTLTGSDVRFLVLDEVDQLIARNQHEYVYTMVKLFPPPRSRPLGPLIGPNGGLGAIGTPTASPATPNPAFSPFDVNSPSPLSGQGTSPFAAPVRRFSSTLAPSPNPDQSGNGGTSPSSSTIADRVERQTALFSNTVPQDVLNLANTIQLREPVRVLVRRDGNVTHSDTSSGSRGLRQFYLYLAFTGGGGGNRGDANTGNGLGIIGSGRGTNGSSNAAAHQAREWKLDALMDLFDDIEITHAIVNVGGLTALDSVVYKLASRGLETIQLHSDMNPGAKVAALNKFRGTGPSLGRPQATRVLVVYDVYVKYSDLFQVPLVINYDLPKAVEDYAPRVAPAISNPHSRSGVVVNFVTATGGDVEMLRSIECFYKIKCPEVPMSLRDVL